MNRCRMAWLCMGALCVLTAACGCGTRPADPPAEAFEAVLCDQKVPVGETIFVLSEGDVSEFELVGIVRNEESQTASARVSFLLDAGRERYRVRGVISYRTQTPGKITAPYFEVNDLAPHP